MALLKVDFSVDLVRALWSQPPIEAHFLDKPSLPQAVKVAANGRLTNSWHRPRDYMCRRLMRQPTSIIGRGNRFSKRHPATQETQVLC